MSGDLQEKAGGVVLKYSLTGNGPEPLICIHGAGASLDTWSGVLKRLKDRFTVLTFELRGHDHSSNIKGRYEVDDLASEALALAGNVGFDTYYLAGSSRRGPIAQRIALTAPERVRRLVMLSTIAIRNADECEPVMTRLAALKSGERESYYDASVSRFSDAFRETHPEITADMRQQNTEYNPECNAAAIQVLAGRDLGSDLDSIPIPTLIASGEYDVGSNSRLAPFMQGEITESEIRILPGQRHSILFEAPDLVGSMMWTFLENREAVDG